MCDLASLIFIFKSLVNAIINCEFNTTPIIARKMAWACAKDVVGM